ncbi:hypothetical protein HLB23_17480 [Nocardia uniformis]|uniref:Uncharacterized protein n=1 Tax=Nocardia uniformis TaxID=53432 RepID=A0A849C5M3_9NOCA|nr:hypothetical protein [Nocardia uniformis]NNH71635.1 hypothetical protein [Nocardia uniformis]
MSDHTDRSLIDAIDQLVDEQLAEGEPCGGYDYGDPTFPRCPNPWCGEDWHGLPITARMAEMRWHRELDPEYRYHDDESMVLCPGSAYDGEFTAPHLRTRRRLTGPQPQWWCCFQATDLDIDIDGRDAESAPNQVRVNGEVIFLAPDIDGTTLHIRYDPVPGTNGSRRTHWIALRALESPRSGVWVNWRPDHPDTD